MAATSVVSVVAVHHRNVGFHHVVSEILRQQSFRIEMKQCVGTALVFSVSKTRASLVASDGRSWQRT